MILLYSKLSLNSQPLTYVRLITLHHNKPKHFGMIIKICNLDRVNKIFCQTSDLKGKIKNNGNKFDTYK